MKTLTLKNKFQTNATLLPNDFIDNYMVNANGEFIKVYLFLLRHAEDDNPALTLSMIADCLNNTEKDILRALRYWESEGLLRSEYAADGKITSLELQSFACAWTPPASRNTDSPAGGIAPQTVRSTIQNVSDRNLPSQPQSDISLSADQPTKAEAFDKLLKRIHPGAIVLLHSTSKTNADILDELLTKWKEMGYQIKPLTQLP